MRLFRLMTMLMMVLGLAFLSACADNEGAEAVPPVGEEVEPEFEGEAGVEPEFGEEAEIEPAIEGEATEFDEQFSTLEGYGVDERDQFENEFGTMMQQYDTRLSELEAQAAGMDEAGQAEFNEEIDSLRQQRDAFQQQFDQLQTATDEEWEGLRSGIMTSIEDYERSFDEIESMGG